MKKKDMYVSPQVEVIEVENEGVIAASASGGISDMPNGGNISNVSSRSYQGGGASSNDLDDLINDILTVEQ